ncbi:MAG: hypothetical protein Q8P63_03115 [Candidatus Nealsonbacteria bacterium]|nr:hypothetical protein [Candidatus Nealsonbacteria bacterium]
MIERLRRPKAEKMRRGYLLIEAFLPEIRVLEGNAFKSYSDWQTDYVDYRGMLRVARKVAVSGVRIHIDSTDSSAETPSQFNAVGTIRRPGVLNTDTLIDKTVNNIYEKEQTRKEVSDEEIHHIIEQAELLGENIAQVWESQVIPRIPRTKNEIRRSLLTKLFSRMSRD